jgi:uncharacterized protein (DUF1778 family)
MRTETKKESKTMSATAKKLKREERQEVSYHIDEMELVRKAAVFKGMSVPDFLRFVSLDASRKTIQEKNYFELTSRDWDLLAVELNSPSEPTEALRKLMKRKG